ncbi:unnamed protein product [Effrenium voratum]|uniref:Protein-serine/threonine kinase n=1 Tax=Effrenium voratum TaxID=2562239 RepID=A0AA36NIR9_9DINO|nr:unnamed protein product [Effrenium voratum]CAJ1408559.1 unnamed protein product [Effrenium voratum]
MVMSGHVSNNEALQISLGASRAGHVGDPPQTQLLVLPGALRDFQTTPGDSACNPLQRPKQGGVLAGFGVGLTLSRLYAQYFGGDLRILSLDGFGTDVFLHLNRLGTACEDLPKDVLYSPSMRDSSALEIPTQEQLLISAEEEAFLRHEPRPRSPEAMRHGNAREEPKTR